MLNKIISKQTPRAFLHTQKSPKTVDELLTRFDPSIAQQFNHHQWQEVRRIINLAISKPSPKIIDLRFTVDLIISRFYFTLLVGEDVRRQARKNSAGSRIGNLIAAICLILTLNFLVSISIFGMAYLLKSALGIDLFPGHLSDMVMG